MTVYNTAADAANTAVRAFLTKVGEYYLNQMSPEYQSFDTGNGKGKGCWERIKHQTFEERCAYCGDEAEKLQIEHLVMFNRTECGLHHPGNIVPCCKECNKRARDPESQSVPKKYVSWGKHLEKVCKDRNQVTAVMQERKEKINQHIDAEKYPLLSKEEAGAIKVIAESLYSNIQTESEKSLALYKKLREEFVR
tara:strand:+ start:244 stop:825 length:582 start_codon:yes stop_codon:yes gene_type:complete